MTLYKINKKDDAFVLYKRIFFLWWTEIYYDYKIEAVKERLQQDSINPVYQGTAQQILGEIV